MKHRSDMKVVVGYCFYGPVEHAFMSSVVCLFQYDAVGMVGEDGKKRGGKQHIVNGGGLMARSTALLVRARTELCQLFLDEHDADWLFMVDADMEFEPDVVDRLLDAAHPVDRPIVGGLAFSYMRGEPQEFWPTLYQMVRDENRFERLAQYPGNQLIPVGATGAACLLVHRSVLAKMRDKYPPPRSWFAETVVPASAEMPDGDVLSEDLTFCLRALGCGFPIHVHTGIKFGHIKNFSADEQRFIEECERLTAPKGTVLPTFAVVASRNREKMLRTLYDQLSPQCTVLVFDNGYETPPVEETFDADGLTLHQMWNWGLDEAARRSNGPHNVLILNDDVEIGPQSVAKLEAALRTHSTIGCVYPNPDVPVGQLAEVIPSGDGSGQTLSGWCFMLRGEDKLRFDEQFEWWYGDSDVEKQLRRKGRKVCGVGGVEIRHLDPLTSSMSPDRLAMAERDEARFAAKWKLDPGSLWLAQHPEFGGRAA